MVADAARARRRRRARRRPPTGAGVGPQPEATTVVVEPLDQRRRHDGRRSAPPCGAIADPPPHVVAAVEAFDPDRTAVAFASFLNESPALAGRPFVAHRRPEWVALEDKTVVDALLDRAGVDAGRVGRSCPSATAAGAWRSLDVGARHGVGRPTPATATTAGPRCTRWVTDDDEAAAVDRGAGAALRPRCGSCRSSTASPRRCTASCCPTASSPLRPVELVTLRRGHDLRYAGCATFWDPPAGGPRRDARRRPAGRRAAAGRGRLPRRVHARRRGDGRRLPADRAEPALRRRPRRDHARPRRRAAAPRARPRRRRRRAADRAPPSWRREILERRRRRPRRRHAGRPASHAGEPSTSRPACYVDGAWRWAGDGEPADGARHRPARASRASTSIRRARRSARASGRGRSTSGASPTPSSAPASVR